MSVAYLAFKEVIPQKGSATSEDEVEASDPSNYDIVVTQNEKEYIIDFKPAANRSRGVRGGAYQYIINKEGYKVVNVTARS
ncbi:hypothetical protein ACTOWJ_02830 [Lysobacter sp. CA199]